jgi:hypothetical protein
VKTACRHWNKRKELREMYTHSFRFESCTLACRADTRQSSWRSSASASTCFLNKQPNYQIEQSAATITNQNKRLMTNRTCRFSSVAAVQLMSCFPCCSFVRVGLPRSYREHLTPFPSEWRPVFFGPVRSQRVTRKNSRKESGQTGSRQ